MSNILYGFLGHFYLAQNMFINFQFDFQSYEQVGFDCCCQISILRDAFFLKAAFDLKFVDNKEKVYGDLLLTVRQRMVFCFLNPTV